MQSRLAPLHPGASLDCIYSRLSRFKASVTGSFVMGQTLCHLVDVAWIMTCLSGHVLLQLSSSGFAQHTSQDLNAADLSLSLLLGFVWSMQWADEFSLRTQTC